MKNNTRHHHIKNPKVRLVLWPLYIISWPIRHISRGLHRVLKNHPRLDWMSNESLVGFMFASCLMVSLFLVEHYLHQLWFCYTLEVTKAACAEPILHGLGVIAKVAQEACEDVG